MNEQVQNNEVQVFTQLISYIVTRDMWWPWFQVPNLSVLWFLFRLYKSFTFYKMPNLKWDQSFTLLVFNITQHLPWWEFIPEADLPLRQRSVFTGEVACSMNILRRRHHRHSRCPANQRDRRAFTLSALWGLVSITTFKARNEQHPCWGGFWPISNF